MKQLTFFIGAALLFMTNSANAIVKTQSEHHFTINVEVTIKASVEDVYQQFLQVGDWWESSHTWFGDASKMSIEPKAGGCFCEINGDKEALHMTVSAVTPNKNLQMIGALGPLQSMAVNGHMSWNFESPVKGITKVSLNYLVKGFTEQEVKAMAQAVDGVLTTQVTNLKARFKE